MYIYIYIYIQWYHITIIHSIIMMIILVYTEYIHRSFDKELRQISCEPTPGGLLQWPHHHGLDGHGAARDLRTLHNDLGEETCGNDVEMMWKWCGNDVEMMWATWFLYVFVSIKSKQQMCNSCKDHWSHDNVYSIVLWSPDDLKS